MAFTITTIECTGNSTLINLNGNKINIGNDFEVLRVTQGVKVMYKNGEDIEIRLAETIYNTVQELEDALFACSKGSSGGGNPGGGTQTALETPFAPTGNVASSTVQGAIVEVQAQVDGLQSASGLTQGATNFGGFDGNTLPNNQTTKQLFQVIENELESINGVTQLSDLTALAASDLSTGSIVTLQSNGARYKIESSAPSGYSADSILVVADSNSKFAVLQEPLKTSYAGIDNVEANAATNNTRFSNLVEFSNKVHDGVVELDQDIALTISSDSIVRLAPDWNTYLYCPAKQYTITVYPTNYPVWSSSDHRYVFLQDDADDFVANSFVKTTIKNVKFAFGTIDKTTSLPRLGIYGCIGNVTGAGGFLVRVIDCESTGETDRILYSTGTNDNTTYRRFEVINSTLRGLSSDPLDDGTLIQMAGGRDYNSIYIGQNSRLIGVGVHQLYLSPWTAYLIEDSIVGEDYNNTGYWLQANQTLPSSGTILGCDYKIIRNCVFKNEGGGLINEDKENPDYLPEIQIYNNQFESISTSGDIVNSKKFKYYNNTNNVQGSQVIYNPNSDTFITYSNNTGKGKVRIDSGTADKRIRVIVSGNTFEDVVDALEVRSPLTDTIITTINCFGNSFSQSSSSLYQFYANFTTSTNGAYYFLNNNTFEGNLFLARAGESVWELDNNILAKSGKIYTCLSGNLNNRAVVKIRNLNSIVPVSGFPLGYIDFSLFEDRDHNANNTGRLELYFAEKEYPNTLTINASNNLEGNINPGFNKYTVGSGTHIVNVRPWESNGGIFGIFSTTNNRYPMKFIAGSIFLTFTEDGYIDASGNVNITEDYHYKAGQTIELKVRRTGDYTVSKWWDIVNDNQSPKGYVENSGSPSGSVTPAYIGQECLDTTNDAWYKAYGLTNTDWQAL